MVNYHNNINILANFDTIDVNTRLTRNRIKIQKNNHNNSPSYDNLKNYDKYSSNFTNKTKITENLKLNPNQRKRASALSYDYNNIIKSKKSLAIHA